MKKLTDQIHLKNILACIEDIEDYCPDITPQELREEEVIMPIYRNFTMLGIEANLVYGSHEALTTLKSFKKADFIEGIGRDIYALYNFIVNELSKLKSEVMSLISSREKSQSTPRLSRMSA
ncbi:hypothetical protein LVD15_15795 [Fulvivirga maritima]|uniref:hypothetical protein n=1 Tax=Fulvivirga maritima TaxID=2904247 RepID=UPI001F1FFEBB|nr:hypothetical protein [Fulvivirga maritima]UII24773.1 hypothetical protein LVD15_15795 [Fulvivirga maritima]